MCVLESTPFWDEVDASPPFQVPISEKERYIFPFPFMAIVPFSGLAATEVRIPSHPPTEHGSLVLQATMGCPWNRCLFCGGRKNIKFMPRVEEVKEDILLAKKYYEDKPQRIFLGDGNSVALRTDKLLEIVNLCFENFHELERVSTYASARFIIKKGLDELRSLSKAGLRKMYVGLETGDDELLQYMNKGATAEEMIKAADMARDAGIELSATVLLGLGGAGSWKRNAELTARVLNAMKPPETRPHHLILQRSSPLYDIARKGEFKEASRYEILKELRALISLLDYETDLHIHRLTIRGPPIKRKMPEEKEKILNMLDFALYRFFDENIDPERIKGYTMRDILKWDGYMEPPSIDYDDLV